MLTSSNRYWQIALTTALALVTFGLSFARPEPADQELADQARATLDRAAHYVSTELAANGTYVWRYSEDLSVRKGEGDAGPTVGWVQPPGTPAVGAAFLRIHEVTGENAWLDAAKASGMALVRTQLISGGWYYSIEMDKAARSQWCYRVDGVTPETCAAIKENKIRNRTLLDDDTTQSALRFLIWLDNATGGDDAAIRDAISYGLEKLARAQYPNGAFPVVIEKKVKFKGDGSRRKAKIPETWSKTWVKPSGGPYYILNDNVVRDTVHLYLVAEQKFHDPKLLEVAVKAGDFLIDAQLPKPQQGWAQIYDGDMQPVWGRKFEPPAVVSRETAGAITCLVELYHRTGETRFLTAAREAAAWLRAVRLPDGDWARFYELSTNRPLYVDNDENLTYDTGNLLDHYSLKSEADIPQALAYLDAVEGGGKSRPLWPSPADDMSEGELQTRVQELVRSADDRGRWVEGGWIQSGTFVDAAFVIADYLKR